MDWTYFLACIISVSSLAAGQTPQYVLKGTATQLKPDIPRHPNSILWKHNGNKVVEFDGSTQQVFGSYEKRITLDEITAELGITDLRSEDSGTYELEVAMMNSYLQTKEYQLEVIDKVAKPTISCEINTGSSLDESEVQATLLCSAEKPEPLMEFEWISQGSSYPGDKITFSLTDKEDDEQYTCAVSNPWSSETATFTVKDCYHEEEEEEEESSPVMIIVLSILALIAVVGTALGILFCKLKQKACFANDKEKQAPSEESDNRTSQKKPLLSEGKDGNEKLQSTQPLRQNDSDNNEDSSETDNNKQESDNRTSQKKPLLPEDKDGNEKLQSTQPLRQSSSDNKDDSSEADHKKQGYVNSQAHQSEQPETQNEGNKEPVAAPPPGSLCADLPTPPVGQIQPPPSSPPSATARTTNHPPQQMHVMTMNPPRESPTMKPVQLPSETVSGRKPDEHMEAASPSSPPGGADNPKDPNQPVKVNKESDNSTSQMKPLLPEDKDGNKTPPSTEPLRQTDSDNNDDSSDSDNKEQGDVDSQADQLEQPETQNEGNKGPVAAPAPGSPSPSLPVGPIQSPPSSPTPVTARTTYYTPMRGMIVKTSWVSPMMQLVQLSPKTVLGMKTDEAAFSSSTLGGADTLKDPNQPVKVNKASPPPVLDPQSKAFDQTMNEEGGQDDVLNQSLQEEAPSEETPAETADETSHSIEASPVIPGQSENEHNTEPESTEETAEPTTGQDTSSRKRSPSVPEQEGLNKTPLKKDSDPPTDEENTEKTNQQNQVKPGYVMSQKRKFENPETEIEANQGPGSYLVQDKAFSDKTSAPDESPNQIEAPPEIPANTANEDNIEPEITEQTLGTTSGSDSSSRQRLSSVPEQEGSDKSPLEKDSHQLEDEEKTEETNQNNQRKSCRATFQIQLKVDKKDPVPRRTIRLTSQEEQVTSAVNPSECIKGGTEQI